MKIMKNGNVYKRFQPATTLAVNSIRELLSRGGTIVVDKADFVEIRRQESVAKIDRLGRVEWRQYEG